MRVSIFLAFTLLVPPALVDARAADVAGAAKAEDKAKGKAKSASTPAQVELAKPAPELEFKGVALSEAIQSLQAASTTNFFLDPAGLDAAGVGADAKVTVAKSDKATVKSVLSAALASATKGKKGKLTFQTAGNVVLISTADRAKKLAAAHRKDVQRGISDADREALAREIPTLDVTGVQLADVLQFLPDLLGTPVEPDWEQLEDAGLTKEQTVTVKLQRVTVAQLIRLLIDTARPKKPVDFVTIGGKTLISQRAALKVELGEADNAAKARARLEKAK